MVVQLLAAVLVGQGQVAPPLRDLPLTTAPLSAPKVIRDLGLKPVTISQIEYEPDRHTIRVFRYTFRGELTPLLKKWQVALKKEGWTYEEPDKHGLAAFELPKPKPPLIQQAMLIRAAKIVRDEKQRAATRFDADKGWIGISYNEIVPIGYWDKKR